MTYIDIHCHPYFQDYDADREEVIARMKAEGVFGICVGTDLVTSKLSIETASQYGFAATVGQHPTHVDDFDATLFELLAKEKGVVAIGECGLDYFRREKDEIEIKRQKNIFKLHIALAKKFDLPLMIHCRPSAGSMDAYEDALSLLEGADVKGNVHFFVGNDEIATRFLKLGFTMSFTGVITFTHDYDQTIKMLPLDSIMSETDAPFVAPVPYRGKRNEPVYVKEVVKRLAELKEVSLENMAEAIMSNAKRVFRL